MNKVIDRLRNNLKESEEDEEGMEVVQAVLLIVVGLAIVGGIFALVKMIMDNAKTTSKKQTDDFNNWVEHMGK